MVKLGYGENSLYFGYKKEGAFEESRKNVHCGTLFKSWKKKYKKTVQDVAWF